MLRLVDRIRKSPHTSSSDASAMPLRRGAPRLSIVLLDEHGTTSGNAVFGKLAAACEALGIELVVILRSRAAGAAGPTLPGGSIRQLTAPDGAGTSELRELGMRAAKGDIVSIVDDERGALERIERHIASQSRSGEHPAFAPFRVDGESTARA